MPFITQQEAADNLSPIFNGKFGKFLFDFAAKVTGLDNAFATYDRIEQAGVPFGPDFAKAILDDLDVDFRVGNAERLEQLPDGAFIVIANHIYGHLDGICLVDLIGHKRPQVKVMVNEMLMWIKGLAPNFISVNPSTDGTKKKGLEVTNTSINGIRGAFDQLHNGEPLALFPSGAVADPKPKEHWALKERDWQDTAVRIIKKARIPVIPIRFFDRNSRFYYNLQLIDYRLRFIRLFHEAYNKRGTFPRVGIGKFISVEEQDRYKDLQEYKAFLRSHVDEMPEPDHYIKRSELWK